MKKNVLTKFLIKSALTQPSSVDKTHDHKIKKEEERLLFFIIKVWIHCIALKLVSIRRVAWTERHGSYLY